MTRQFGISMLACLVLSTIGCRGTALEPPSSDEATSASAALVGQPASDLLDVDSVLAVCPSRQPADPYCRVEDEWGNYAEIQLLPAAYTSYCMQGTIGFGGFNHSGSDNWSGSNAWGNVGVVRNGPAFRLTMNVTDILFYPPGGAWSCDVTPPPTGPDPARSSFETQMLGLPSGVFDTPQSNFPAEDGYQVVVRNAAGAPMAGVAVTLDFAQAIYIQLYQAQEAGTTIDCAGRKLTRVSDASGVATFRPRFGGSASADYGVSANTIRIFADGVRLNPTGPFISATSPDFDRNGVVNGADEMEFMLGLRGDRCDEGDQCPLSDFDGDGRRYMDNDDSYIFYNEMNRGVIAWACGVPIPTSTFETHMLGTPSGSASTPRSDFAAEDGYQVVVRDAAGLPRPGVTVTLDFAQAIGIRLFQQQEAGTVVNCATRTLTRTTNSVGVASFRPRFGGSASLDYGAATNTIRIFVNGARLNTVGPFITAASPDFNQNGRIDGIDEMEFTYGLRGDMCDSGDQCPLSDFDGDGRRYMDNDDYYIFYAEMDRNAAATPCS